MDHNEPSHRRITLDRGRAIIMGANSSSTKEEEEDQQNKELDKEKDNPDNKKMEADDNFKGPSDESNRRCTDFICLLMLMAAWFSMTMVGFVVCGVIDSPDLPAGNPAKLTHASE